MRSVPAAASGVDCLLSPWKLEGIICAPSNVSCVILKKDDKHLRHDAPAESPETSNADRMFATYK